MRVVVALFVALWVCPSSAETPQMFPPDVVSSGDYFDNWYGPVLARMGEKPLTELAARDHAAHIRFTFFPGAQMTRGPVATTIRLRVPASGKASLVARRMLNDHGSKLTRTIRRQKVLEVQTKKIEELASQSGVWAFRSGSWQSDPNDLYVHCTELIMERAQGQEYSVSHVLISCEQPQKLMPLVDYLVSLSRLKPTMLNYSR